ncbi:hypothetical protein SAMN05660199_01363 [Klenkia soli]|uniref:4-amino-4-deoxy-L-arabinose transferase n=1 Tax=Klenkia soli TaxID=1052260 RepID=A0A1H0H6S3_9ACTN|nr:DUF6541 family protein [Klenkia soli]SDO14916.1 hypothetical protein SAMN05660199_01363 [Klenkia soli]
MIVVLLLLVVVPGALICAAAGVRGWRLAGVAPAATFGAAAVGGPALGAVGIRWDLWSYAGWTLLLVAVVAAVAWLVRRRRPAVDGTTAGQGVGTAGDELPRQRARWEHLLVGGGVALGMAVGAAVFLRASRGLSAIAQDFDAPFHANAVRWIAEHGEAVPASIAPIANLAEGTPYFYPITYHSVLALLVQVGSDPSYALNAGALLVTLAWPLGIAALGMSWRVPAPVVAVAATVSTWFTAFPYDSLFRGPLWPYVAGLALLPGVLAVARMLVDRSPVVPAVVALALGVTGVVAMHPSIAFVVLVYAVALLVAFVLRLEPVVWRASLVPMLVGAVLAAVLLLPVVLPARVQSGGVQAARWPEFATTTEGFGQVLLFSPVTLDAQWWLGLTALVGLFLLVLRRRLVWLVGAFAVFGAAYAATASIDSPLVNSLSGPFYNDAWRFAALLPLVGTFAVGETVVTAGSWLGARLRVGRPWVMASAGSLVVLLAVAVLGDGAYVQRNVDRLSINYGDGPTVSADEVAAYEWLGEHVEPGQRVMNDQWDGSVWMYALAGVEPMEWTFYGAPAGTPAAILTADLHDLDTSQRVQEAVREADVRYVVVGLGFVRDNVRRAPGLIGLQRVQGLTEVFRNADATIYEVTQP